MRISSDVNQPASRQRQNSNRMRQSGGQTKHSEQEKGAQRAVHALAEVFPFPKSPSIDESYPSCRHSPKSPMALPDTRNGTRLPQTSSANPDGSAAGYAGWRVQGDATSSRKSCFVAKQPLVSDTTAFYMVREAGFEPAWHFCREIFLLATAFAAGIATVWSLDFLLTVGRCP